MTPQGRILVGIAIGIVAGIACNLLAPGSAEVAWTIEHVTTPLGTLFLRLLFMLVVPLLFTALVMGVCELDLKQLGRLGARLLGYTVVVSAIAVVIGVFLVNTIGPGRGLSEEVRALATQSTGITAAPAPTATNPAALIVSMVPDNAVRAMADGDMIGVLIFALFFGSALAMTDTAGARVLKDSLQGLYDTLMRLIDWVLLFAPVGVGALLFTMTARVGFEILGQLLAFVGVVVLGLALHMFVVYSVSVRVFGGMSPVKFFKDVRLAMVTAFSTASSSATLPTALKVAEENLKLPRHVSRFVLTAGSAMNQNGTALFEGVTVLFLAQIFGVELSILQQVGVMGICILAGIGTAGIPAGSIPVIAMILTLFDIPPEGIGLILGVDRLLDMCRTTVNVTGDLAAAVYVGRGEPRGQVHEVP